jgi:hypothetical protein
MPASIDCMVWSVAGRFGFNGLVMPLSELIFWYKGHIALSEEEKKAYGK